jgi:hypothetical protein
VGIERLGWLRWSWRRPVAGLVRLIVRDALREPGSIRVYESVAAAVEANVIVPIWGADSSPEATRKELAPGYPRSWLLPLANDLARRCQFGEVFAAAFTPDGTRLVTGGRDRAVHIWNPITGDPLALLHGHHEYIFALTFSPDGATLVSGSGDHTVRLWGTTPLQLRLQARRELEAMRPEAEALVRRLLGEGNPPDRVLECVRADPLLKEPLRRAAWHAVLRLAK